MKPLDAVRRWWRDRHPDVIEHREPPKLREKHLPVEHGPTKAPFSREARRARNRARERSHAAGTHPSYPSRR